MPAQSHEQAARWASFFLQTGIRAAVLLLAWHAETAGAQPGVGGRVQDEAGRPLAGAFVILDPASSNRGVETDSAGGFLLSRVSVGSHELLVLRVGYEPHPRTVDVPEAGVFDITVVMRRITRLDTIAVVAARPGIYGRMFARESMVPLGGGTIEVTGRSFGAGGTAKASDRGEFSLTTIKPGAYLVRAKREGYQSRTLPVLVPVDGGVELAIALNELTRLTKVEKHQERLRAEFDRRQKWRAAGRSAFVPGHEIAPQGRMSVADALRFSPAFLISGLVLRDSIACVFVNGVAKPYATASDYDAAEVEAVEVFGMRAELSNTLRFQGPPNSCGRGAAGPIESDRKTGVQPKDVRSGRIAIDDYVRIISIWLKQ